MEIANLQRCFLMFSNEEIMGSNPQRRNTNFTKTVSLTLLDTIGVAYGYILSRITSNESSFCFLSSNNCMFLRYLFYLFTFF